MSSIMGVIRPEQLELFALELECSLEWFLVWNKFVISSLIDFKLGICVCCNNTECSVKEPLSHHV